MVALEPSATPGEALERQREAFLIGLAMGEALVQRCKRPNPSSFAGPGSGDPPEARTWLRDRCLARNQAGLIRGTLPSESLH